MDGFCQSFPCQRVNTYGIRNHKSLMYVLLGGLVLPWRYLGSLWEPERLCGVKAAAIDLGHWYLAGSRLPMEPQCLLRQSVEDRCKGTSYWGLVGNKGMYSMGI